MPSELQHQQRVLIKVVRLSNKQKVIRPEQQALERGGLFQSLLACCS